VGTPDNRRASWTAALGAATDLATVRAELEDVEALEDEVAHRMADLGALLPRGQFRLIWELLDAEQRHGQAERLLAIHGLAAGLARELPEHADAIRAAVGGLLGEGTEVGEVA
jgi:hypothetical protein